MSSSAQPPQTPSEVVECAAIAASSGWSDDAGRRTRALLAIAGALDARRGEIIAKCATETALYEQELAPEFDRMTGTLRLFASLIETSEWRRTTHSPPSADGSSVGPNHDLRSMLMPLGEVVAVFGASNFPLAYGVCGGDTASALAAGCAVVVKEHPAHPKTGRLIASIVRSAIASTGASEDLLGYVQNEDPADFAVARELVQHPSVCGAGFTGSTRGGLAIEKLARERVELDMAPIPVFAEMGSSNVVIVTRGAWAERGERIADELAASITARCGQQCTRAGIIIIDRAGSPNSERADDPTVDLLERQILKMPARRMLSERIREDYIARIADPREYIMGYRVRRGATSDDPRAVPSALIRRLLPDMFDPENCEEIFGPACVLVHADLDDESVLQRLLLGIDGDRESGPMGVLAASIYLGDVVRDADRAAVRHLTRVAGRIIFNGVPTGVRVCESMVHAGAYPATNQPQATAVGPRAIERWCRPVCFQNAPPDVLPPGMS